MSIIELECILQELRQTQEEIEHNTENKGILVVTDYPNLELEFLRDLNELEEEKLLFLEEADDWY